MATINLGKKWNDSPVKPAGSSDSKMSYPSLYLDGVKGLDLETGDIEFTAKGKVTSCTERDDGTCSCTIEVHEMDCQGCEEEGLDEALKKIASKKMEMDSDEDGE